MPKPLDTARRATTEEASRQRAQLLEQVEEWLDWPMLALSLAWLALFVVEVTAGLGPFLERVGLLIWGVFVLDFLVRFALAPEKLCFLGRNVLTIISLLVPALRAFRLFRFFRLLRAARAVRGIRLVKALSSLNRGLRLTRAAASRRGLGYVVALSTVVLVLGAAGMRGLESGQGSGFDTFGASLWWTGRILMTIGPENWPVTPEGRLLSLLLALYGYAVFGYVTASIATILLGKDQAEAEEARAGPTTGDLLAEIAALRRDLALGRRDLSPPADPA